MGAALPVECRIADLSPDRYCDQVSGVQSIERAFALLRALSLGPVGITDLADRTNLPKSTVARLLSALEAETAVIQQEVGGDYELGPGLSDLTGANAAGFSLIAAARPFLVDLATRNGESSGLDVLSDGWVEFVDEVTGEQDVQVRNWTGEFAPAHSVPGGVAILAYSPESVVKTVLETPLDKLTANTITDVDELRQRLVQARSAGYIWGFEEFAPGINSVAAPVFDETGVVAALRVHGPMFRFPDPNRAHDIGLEVAEAAEALSQQLQAYTATVDQ